MFLQSLRGKKTTGIRNDSWRPNEKSRGANWLALLCSDYRDEKWKAKTMPRPKELNKTIKREALPLTYKVWNIVRNGSCHNSLAIGLHQQDFDRSHSRPTAPRSAHLSRTAFKDCPLVLCSTHEGFNHSMSDAREDEDEDYVTLTTSLFEAPQSKRLRQTACGWTLSSLTEQNFNSKNNLEGI